MKRLEKMGLVQLENGNCGSLLIDSKFVTKRNYTDGGEKLGSSLLKSKEELW